MSSQPCDFDTEGMTELPPAALLLCPRCLHWVHAGRPHPTEFVAPPVPLDQWSPYVDE